MSFKDKPFKDRYNDPMWHHSEDYFEERWPYLWDRFGLNQDDMKVSSWALDPFIRHTPDYVSQLHQRGTPFLVEVQGTGTKKPSHKFKFDKLEVLKQWNRHQDVWLWLWNDKIKQEDVISVNMLQLVIAQGKATKGLFDGHRPYWDVPVDVITEFSDWERNKGRYE